MTITPNAPTRGLDGYRSTLLQESEWELGGVRFGGPRSRPLAIVEASFPEWDVDDEDFAHPTLDGIMPGTDRDRGSTIAFTVVTAHTRSAEDGMALARTLTSAWRKGRDLPPGAMMPLIVRAGGRHLRVYGRPRRYSHPVPDLRAQLGKILIHLDFKVMIPVVFDETEYSVSMHRATESSGGLKFPAREPFLFRETGDDIRRAVRVEGETPVPFRAIFTGPASSQRIVGPSWEVALTKGLSSGETCVVDTLTQLVTVNGAVRPDMISRSTRLTSRLQPGWSGFKYLANDPTNLSTGTLAWRAGWSSL